MARICKVQVSFGGKSKHVRFQVKFCSGCRAWTEHVFLKPGLFSEAFHGAKTEEVCIGCHTADRHPKAIHRSFVFALADAVA